MGLQQHAKHREAGVRPRCSLHTRLAGTELFSFEAEAVLECKEVYFFLS